MQKLIWNCTMQTRLLILLVLLCCCCNGMAQDSTNKVVSVSYAEQVSNKAEKLGNKLNKQTAKALRQLKKQEARIYKKLAKKDSLKAKEVFGVAKEKYAALENKVKRSSSLNQYIPSLDSLSTSLQFLQQNPQLLSSAKRAKEKLDKALSNVKGLEDNLQKAEDIKQFLKERKQYLQQQLSGIGFAKNLKAINKQVYYYSQQLNEYKLLLKDRKKAESKALELLSKTKLFKDFMAKNSLLTKFFPMSSAGSSANSLPQSGFAGLQTRQQLSSYIQQSGFAGSGGISQLQQNIQGAQSQITEIRNKILQAGGTNSDDLEVPDFKINNQRTKSFFERIEVGTNIQSQRSRSFFPATSDLGISAGYKLNDKSTIGIGASYKMGLGKGWNRINLTHEGVGLRSFIDWKIKGSIWISGGYEQNFQNRIRSVEALKDMSSWQQSGLIGLSKVISLKTTFLKKTKVQLLWDFLSYQQVPVTQPLLFRIGYSF